MSKSIAERCALLDPPLWAGADDLSPAMAGLVEGLASSRTGFVDNGDATTYSLTISQAELDTATPVLLAIFTVLAQDGRLVVTPATEGAPA